MKSELKKLSKKGLLILGSSLMVCGCSVVPDVDWCELRRDNMESDMDCLYNDASIPQRPLTLEDIYDIAGERNLNLLVKAQEYCIQKELVTREKLGMLPDLRANYTNSYRNKITASSSESLTNTPPAPLSVSSEKHQLRWDITMVWNYLDFGLSFYRARQEYSRALVMQLEYQRQQQNLFVDVSREYWKAVSAQVAVKKSEELLKRAVSQREALVKQMEAKTYSAIQGLTIESFLVNFQSRVHTFKRDYHSALAELGLLMGLPPGVEFNLAEIEEMGTDVVLGDIAEIEEIALSNRPELYSSDIQEYIQADEARAALLRLFPSAEVYGGQFHDRNRFLLYNYWVETGIRATWALLDVNRSRQDRKIAFDRQALARDNRMMMSVAVLSQVNLAWNVYRDNLNTYTYSRELRDVNQRLLKAAESEKRLGKLNDADLLKYEIESLQVQVEHIRSYGDLQQSLEQLNNSMGVPFYYQNKMAYAGMEQSIDNTEMQKSVKEEVKGSELKETEEAPVEHHEEGREMQKPAHKESSLKNNSRPVKSSQEASWNESENSLKSSENPSEMIQKQKLKSASPSKAIEKNKVEFREPSKDSSLQEEPKPSTMPKWS